MQGRRVYPNEKGHLLLKEGDYGKDKSGAWYVRPPGCHMGSIKNHQVTEHEDGTITVSPSIRITERDYGWHGFLEKGVWRAA